MKICISCGEFNRKLLRIILCNILNHWMILLLTLVVLITINNIPEKEGNINESEIEGIFLYPFLTYVGQSLCIIPELLIKKNLNEKDKNSNSISSYRKKALVNELIFNDLSDRLFVKDKINILIISLLLLIVDYLKYYVSIRKKNFDGDYNFIILFSLFVISLYLYDVRFYSHQYVSLVFMTIIQIIKIIIKYSFYYSYFSDMIKDLLLAIFLGLFEAIIFTYIKYLMQIKFFSPYKATYVFGFINGIITLILFIIFSYISVGDYGFVKYKGQYYFDNLFLIFDTFNVSQYIILSLLPFFLAISKLLFNITINYFTVCHSFLLLEDMNFSLELKEEIEKAGSIPLIIFYSCFLFEIFFGLIFLEIIELNCFGLNKNTNKNIRKRANEENNLLLNENSRNDSELFENSNLNELNNQKDNDNDNDN